MHNGDPLTGRTVNVPAGRPPPAIRHSDGESTTDALQLQKLTQVTDWSTEHLAYLFEQYNGFGYRLQHPHVKSPYLWSYSNHYTSGKYVADGQWSDTAVSQQCGAMVLLKRLQEMGEIRPAVAISMAEAQDIQNAAAGVDAHGWPLKWRYAYSRYPRAFNQIVNDSNRGPWHHTQPDGVEQAGHTDAYEQIVPINEQLAWTHEFSDGIKRDSGDVLLELMELAIQWRRASSAPTSAFVDAGAPPDTSADGIEPAVEPRRRGPVPLPNRLRVRGKSRYGN